ncbi:DDE-type integrase/transposase/recombinase [Streptomyces malaysiensis]|uniref:DDE-type integrase/transposase/recombinase n=1 Tax=Streptomyces malaysiensis TaxID=92644 RepID=UPI00384D2D14
MGRDFTATRPGTRLVRDITYLPTGEGWLDLATREVTGYAMADHHHAELVVDTLRMTHGRGSPEPGRITHSDRGSEYTSAEFRAEITTPGLHQNTGRTGPCFDNAAAESFWAVLKEEISTRVRPDRPPPTPMSSHPSRPSTTGAACASIPCQVPHTPGDTTAIPQRPNTHSIEEECPGSRGTSTLESTPDKDTHWSWTSMASARGCRSPPSDG